MDTIHPSRGATWLLVAVLGPLTLAGCSEALPSVLLHLEDPESLAPTQVRVTIAAGSLEAMEFTRPEKAGAPLAPGQTLRLLLPAEVVDHALTVTVDALVGGTRVGGAEGSARVAKGKETRLTVTLASDVGCPGGDCGCTAETCPQGCCQDGTCVQITSLEACGSAGATCAACDPSSSDRCTQGSCRCGEAERCGEGFRCLEGQCVDAASDCRSDPVNACTTPPSPCHEARGTCQEDGTCAYQPLLVGAPCDDGNACTGESSCDSNGACSGTAEPCPFPPGECYSAGVCDPQTGACTYGFRSAGARCGVPFQSACSASRCDGAGVCEPDVPEPDGTRCENCMTCKRGDCIGPSACGINEWCCDSFGSYQCLGAAEACF